MTIHHVPVVGPPPEDAVERAIVVFDTKTGKRIGHSPHVRIEQVMHRKGKDGAITTTLKITPLKDA